MRIEDAENELRRRFSEAGVELAQASVPQCVDIMTAFYADAPCDGLAMEDADMLLFQYGTYDHSNGPRFYFDLVRQFIRGEGDDEEMFQLELTAQFAPDDMLRALGAFHRWCEARTDITKMTGFIRADAAYEAAAARKPLAVTLKLDLL